MRRSINIILLLFVISATAFSQGKENSLKGVSFKERIVTGGGLGLSFGSTQDFFSVSPVIGYSITKKFMAGTGITYRYTNYKVYKPSIKLNDYAINPFARYMVYKGLFVQIEYEYLNYEFPVNLTETIRKEFNSILAGGGYIQPVGRNLAFYIMVLYNFSYTNSPLLYTPYSSPLILRAGVNIGGFLGI